MDKSEGSNSSPPNKTTIRTLKWCSWSYPLAPPKTSFSHAKKLAVGPGLPAVASTSVSESRREEDMDSVEETFRNLRSSRLMLYCDICDCDCWFRMPWMVFWARSRRFGLCFPLHFTGSPVRLSSN